MKTHLLFDKGRLFMAFGWFKGTDFSLIKLSVLDNEEEGYFLVFSLKIAKFIIEIGLWK